MITSGIAKYRATTAKIVSIVRGGTNLEKTNLDHRIVKCMKEVCINISKWLKNKITGSS